MGVSRESLLALLSPCENCLDQLKTSIKSQYLISYYLTSKILDDVLGKDRDKKSMTDIRKIVKEYGLEIVESELHSNRNFFQNEVDGFLNVYDYKPGAYQWTIFVNEELGELSKRYVIAHEFSHYILNLLQKKSYSENCVKALFPRSIEEQICDLMAAFLLMPLESVLMLLKNYIDTAKQNGNCPVRMEDFLNYLGYELKISDYYVPIFYQYVRHLGGTLYEEEFKGLDGTVVIEHWEDYKELFF